MAAMTPWTTLAVGVAMTADGGRENDQTTAIPRKIQIRPKKTKQKRRKNQRHETNARNEHDRNRANRQQTTPPPNCSLLLLLL